MKRRLQGRVVSNKMEKTIVVAVDRVKEHRLYKKKYTVTKKFKVHADDAKSFKEGDVVVVEETRPLSKTKRWVVVERITESNGITK